MTDFFKPAPEPKTPLGRLRILAPSAGIRVSPLQLGAMSLGSGWKEVLGSMDKESSFKLLDAFVEAGGNFIDTANNYQNEDSETWIGEWMKERGNRDRMVIATKFTSSYRSYAEGKNETVNSAGNHKKSLHISLRDSLKKLQTDYIDILYLHWWDYTTSIEEVMDALHIVVQSGKVLYLGISDTPAWIVSAANTYAKAHGKTPFVIYQGRWNVMLRDFEREILPMARTFGMALAPWDAIGGGRLLSKKQLQAKEAAGEKIRSMMGQGDQSEDEVKYSEVLDKIAQEVGVESVTAVALAYILSKSTYVFPLIGGRKVEHLHDNIKALSIKLSPEQIQAIEGVKKFDIGFPHDMIGGDVPATGKPGAILAGTGTIDFVPVPTPLGQS
ncbi:aryl-alcohol dehydrogenase [Phaffia rhodozyma]|uniref:Aryl-alcohol dehydrogenase n=1 Tax=Phaffia rhodozyma TaxID=264483 RepID=A0A0F7SNS6_PHARH|nr:aryl-alcohol dehydrogenase [Phaffia rhodozyma]